MVATDESVTGEIYDYLRPYQLSILNDVGRYRIILKSRQVGISDLIALEMVLVASGLHQGIVRNNCIIVSKRDTDAKDVIEKCKAWVRRLSLDPTLAPFLETDAYSKSEIRFIDSGFRIVSETQNPDAGRGKTGHLYLDEYAFYQFQREIWTGATPSTESRPDLRITVVSTPNGQGDHFHEIWSDLEFYTDWSRHEISIHDAVADGMPVDVERIRGKYTADQFEQEFECKFLGGGGKYFDKELLGTAKGSMPNEAAQTFLGIDTASVVDHTAVSVVKRQGRNIWLCDIYLLPHMPYESDLMRHRLGQDAVVTALIEYYQPRLAVLDVTGDAAMKKLRGRYALFDLLRAQRPDLPIAGQHITREWKDLWVQKLKVSMQTGVTRFENSRRDRVFSKRFIDADSKDYEQFVGAAFENSPFPILRSDFGKVHRKWLGPNATTFDTHRDEMGHGDSFWAALLGYSAAAMSVGAGKSALPIAAPTEQTIQLPTYTEFL